MADPMETLKRLAKALKVQADRFRAYDAYYRGDHPLQFASEQFRDAFGGMFREFADNWCSLVVDAVEERLTVEGFRFGDPDVNERAWEMWAANGLTADARLCHTEALIGATASVLVWPGEDGAKITVEHPTQVIVETSARNRRQVTAAAKFYVDDDKRGVAYLYLPEVVYRFRSASQVTDGIVDWPQMKWVPEDREGSEDPAEQPNPFAPTVPVVAFDNRPRLIGAPSSELQPVVPIQNAVNKTWADLMVSSEFAADAQRAILGWEPEVDPTTNQAKPPPWKRKDRIWVIPPYEDDQGRLQLPKLEQFAAADPAGYVKVIETGVQHIAAQTRTPPHYLLGQSGAFPSGESLKATETGLVAKVRRKQGHWGHGWVQVMRLAFIAEDVDVDMRGEVDWKDPESRSEAELADAVTKRVAIGVPVEQAFRDLGYSDRQIVEFRTMRAVEGFFAPEVVDAGAAAET